MKTPTDTIYILKEAPSTNWETSDTISLIGVIIVIILFALERFISYNLTRKEISRNWYLDVLLKPSLAEISEFFNTMKVNFEMAVTELEASKAGSHEDYLDLLATKKADCSTLCKKLKLSIIPSIESKHSSVARKIEALILNNVIDLYSKKLGECDNCTKNELIESFNSELYSIKVKLVSELYEPIN